MAAGLFKKIFSMKPKVICNLGVNCTKLKQFWPPPISKNIPSPVLKPIQPIQSIQQKQNYQNVQRIEPILK